MCGVHRPDVTTVEQSAIVLSELEKSLLEKSSQEKIYHQENVSQS